MSVSLSVPLVADGRRNCCSVYFFQKIGKIETPVLCPHEREPLFYWQLMEEGIVVLFLFFNGRDKNTTIHC